MVPEVKDTISTATTVVATGGFILGFNEVLTLILISTGIVLNIVRIYEIKRKKREDK